ncbi:MAG: phosphate:Na+ symporter [Pseudoalteromonas tetraodonis]|jgi:phosphate:Na+ symporter
MALLGTIDATGAQIGTILTGLGGGLALFLYGMRKMTEALKLVAGARMKSFLARLTSNRFSAAFAGAGVTAVIQSSSVTTVLVVGFITSGLLTLSQSIGIILGANIGTTITAQIIAFKVTKYALAMVAAGFVIEVAGKKERTKQCGVALMGLGLIFFGMELMSNAASPLRTSEAFMEMVQQMRSPLIGILAGAVFTALVQSSSATTGIVIVMATEGLLPLEAGIALILGSNVGTCVTALIAGIGRPREALQAAVAHVIFNLAGVALWVGVIPQLADAVRAISPNYSEVAETTRLALETPRQIANAHTLFNVGNALIFIWFTGPLAWLVTKIVPPKAKLAEGSGEPIYLDDFYLEQPAVALDRARMEIVHLGEMALGMVERSYHASVSGARAEIDQLHEDENNIDQLHGRIIRFLGKLSLAELVEPQPERIYEYIAAANYLEDVSDTCGTSLTRAGRKRLGAHIDVSGGTREMLEELYQTVYQSGIDTLQAFDTCNREQAQAVVATKPKVTGLAARAQSHLVQRLVAAEPERISTFRIETDIIENYKRLHTLFRRIAKTVHESEIAVEKERPTDS